jgi:osmotically-inducible protein OsmY
MKAKFSALALIPILWLGVACSSNPRSATNNNRNANSSNPDSVSYKDDVKKALEQADLKDVTVSEDTGKNTITLGGKLHSEDARQKAGDIAKSAAPERIIANEISVEPVGVGSQARSIESNVDGAIEKNYKAALIANGLDKDHIRYTAKNGVLTLKGSVNNARERQEAQQVASSVPNVSQVVNELDVRR